jgi:N-acetylglucosaminyl-diphospho-decaprenol L-rhamnosyltransferase
LKTIDLAIKFLMTEYTLSIIIINWNTRQLLYDCLESVYGNVRDFRFEIYVVDNGSTDGSSKMVLEKFPRVQLIQNQENFGFARANNQAIQLSKGRYILLLNSDTLITTNAIDQMINFADNHFQAGIIGACLVYPDGQLQKSYGRLPSLLSETTSLAGLDKLRLKLYKAKQSSKPIETEFVSGACMMIRKSILQQVGLLDEGFFFFSEEIDLCYRARKVGWRIFYLPSAVVMHIEGGSTGLNAERMLNLYRGKLRYFRKHYGSSMKNKLLITMFIITKIKVWKYSLLKWTKSDFLEREQLWRVVAASLNTENK